MIQSQVAPMQYSPFISPQNIGDIENNIRINVTDMNDKITKLHVRMDDNDEKLEKLKKDFYETVRIKAIDCIASVVLFVVIYIKVYT